MSAGQSLVDRLAVLLDGGYRAALLMTGSPVEAETALAEAAALTSRLSSAGAPVERLRVTFYRILLSACAALERRYTRISGERRLIVAGLDLGLLSGELAALPSVTRAVIVLDLVDAFRPEEIAEVLACPPATARAILHMGYQELQCRMDTDIAAGAIGWDLPNGRSQNGVSLTK